MNGSAEHSPAPMPDALQILIDAMEASVAVVAPSGRIVCVNRTWRQASLRNGGDRRSFYVGANYLDVCGASSGGPAKVASLVRAGLARVLGGAEEFSAEYPCHGPTTRRWFVVVARPFDIDGVRHALVTHRSVTAEKQQEIEVRHGDGTAGSSKGRYRNRA